METSNNRVRSSTRATLASNQLPCFVKARARTVRLPQAEFVTDDTAKKYHLDPVRIFHASYYSN